MHAVTILQIKKGFQIQGQEIKENGQEIKNILPLVKKEIENNLMIRKCLEKLWEYNVINGK